jgi:hypothetical protein
MPTGKKPMTRYEELRAKSIDCLSLAQKAGNPVVRKELMQLAARFRQLAEHVKGNENEQEPVTAAAVIEAQRKRQVRRRRPQG